MAGRNLSYIKQEDPAFLQRFKQQTGYDEGPNVETKRQKLEERDGDESEGEEDQPVVVVLKDGDLTAEEVEKLKQEGTAEEEEPPSDGRIMFKKPVKRSGDVDSGLDVSTKKNKTDNAKAECDSSTKKDKKKHDKSKGVKNTKLLSFDDEEEED